MQTFLKMSSVVYSMAGLGSIEESKIYKDNFQEESGSQDSLKDEMNQIIPRDQHDSVQEDETVSEDVIDTTQAFIPTTKDVNKSIGKC